MSKEVKLALCPFCGGKAELRHNGNSPAYSYSYVACTKCHAQTVAFRVSSEYSSDEAAIESWNNRKTPELDICYKHNVYIAVCSWYYNKSDHRELEEVLKSIPTIKFTLKG